jgi:hypothetical protein
MYYGRALVGFRVYLNLNPKPTQEHGEQYVWLNPIATYAIQPKRVGANAEVAGPCSATQASN